ncbi:MAG TPA: FtsQ-type POTRA domain-containing protein [Gemmatimonadales bacterium]|nr:FtsQ-type POTRA domain-containing protein [Gemmatimonadales bacterium]
MSKPSTGRLPQPSWRTVGMAAAGAVVLAALWLAGPSVLNRMEFFRIRRIEVSGARNHSADAVVDALMLGRRSSVFDDLNGMRRRIARLPAMEEVEVRRRLPGTLVVSVVETEPIALARQRNGRLIPIDLRGLPLPYDPAQAAPDLPIAASADSLLARVLGVFRDADPALFARLVTGARVDDAILLEADGRRLWLSGTATVQDVRAVAAVAADLARRQRGWTELDGRFAGQVIVRGLAAGA